MEAYSFKKWMKLQETGTSTASIAGFSRISIPLVRRTPVGELAGGEEDPFFKKLRKKKKKNTEEE